MDPHALAEALAVVFNLTYVVLAIEYAALTPLMVFGHRLLWSTHPQAETSLAGELATEEGSTGPEGSALPAAIYMD